MTDLRQQRVLVTGGAGFLGSHLVDALVARGAQVSVLDDLSSGKLKNLASSTEKIRFIQGSVTDRARVDAAVADADLVFHLAANADVPRSVLEPELDFQSNIVGSFHVLRACSDRKVRLVATSSAAVYGTPAYVPMDERHPLSPVSPYGASKLSMESLGFAYAQVYELPFTAIRIFNSYGERQDSYVMVDLLKKLSARTDVLEVLGTGEQIRTYCHVSDACSLFISAALSPEAVGRPVNLVGDDTLSIRGLTQKLLEVLGLAGHTEVRFTGKSWPGDIARLEGNGTWAREHLGFRCSVNIEQGLDRLVRWFEADRGVRLRR